MSKVPLTLMAGGFSFDLETREERAVLTLHGELDLANCAELETVVAELSDLELVVVDLSKLEFIDSTGLGLLVRTHNARQAAGRQLVIVEGDGQVRRLLQLTGLSERLQVINKSSGPFAP